MADTESVSHGDLIVCACGSKEYCARDVIEAAFFRGEAEPVWTEFLRGAAADEALDLATAVAELFGLEPNDAADGVADAELPEQADDTGEQKKAQA